MTRASPHAARILVFFIMMFPSAPIFAGPDPVVDWRAVRGTPAGRAAVDEGNELLEQKLDDRRREEYLGEIAGGLGKPGSALAAWLRARAPDFDREAEETTRICRAMAERLSPGPAGDPCAPVERDLREFLVEEGDHHLVYTILVRPFLRPHPLNRVVARWFVRRGDGRLVIPDVLREGSAGFLDSLEAGEEPSPVSAADLRRYGRRLAKEVAGEGGLEARWREALGSGHVICLVGALTPREPPALQKVVVERTPLGRILTAGEDRKYRLNRHLRYETDHMLASLRREAVARREFDAAISSLADGLEDEGLRALVMGPAGRHLIAGLVHRGLPNAPANVEPVSRQEDSESGGDIEWLLARAKTIRAELEAEGAVTRLDPGALEFFSDRTHLLRSSIFYNPRTRAGGWHYATHFPDHHTARLFGVFGWNAKVSKDLPSFLERFDRRIPGLQALARTHEKLIIVINTMPPWLSAYTGDDTFEGGRRSAAEAHPPRDWDTWRELVLETAKRFRQVKGVERYYEFWNEPDLKYWQGSLADFLRLYEVTARAIRKADPEGKVGGCAPNQWDGKIRKGAKSGALNLEFIRAVAKRDLPFDFISWHHFGRPLSAIPEAKEAYTAECRRVGIGDLPEFLITEWSHGGRGTPYAPGVFADVMTALYEAGVTAQTAACWEEFHARPDPRHFPPWGLITQQGVRKNAWYVHRFFDRLSRESEGVAVVRAENGRIIVLSRKQGGVLDLLLWQKGTAPPFEAAIEHLRAQGLGNRELAAFGTKARLESAIREGRTAEPRWAAAFASARKIYEDEPRRSSRVLFEFPIDSSIEVLGAEAVTMTHGPKRVVVAGYALTFPIEGYEVVRLTLRIGRRASGPESDR